ncbi:hypothetical protein LV779_23260 [Streptomyces thinghirensis]|nr:hypothetical protein [Streptomyces thinghirensis]
MRACLTRTHAERIAIGRPVAAGGGGRWEVRAAGPSCRAARAPRRTALAAAAATVAAAALGYGISTRAGDDGPGAAPGGRGSRRHRDRLRRLLRCR